MSPLSHMHSRRAQAYSTSHLLFNNIYTVFKFLVEAKREIQGGSIMTGTDLCVNKPHCAAAVRP